MLTMTHIKLANYIYYIFKQQYGIRLNKKNLIYGSIKPDFMKNKVPHYIDKSIDYIDKEIESLIDDSNKISIKVFSRRLGMIMHYISDYFCRAHNTEYYRKNLVAHLKYEKRLARKMQLRKMKKVIESNSRIECIKNYIVDLNKDYMKGKSLERDNEYTIKAINCVCRYIVEKNIQQERIKAA